MGLNGSKVAIITGASSGIGAGLVEAYRRHGYGVVANSRTITESPHPEVIAVPGDIADPATAEQLVAEAVTRFGHVGTLVVQLATQTDAVVAEQFISVVGMIDSPACLLRPAMVIRILKAPGHRHTQRSTARLSSSKACVEK